MMAYFQYRNRHLAHTSHPYHHSVGHITLYSVPQADVLQKPENKMMLFWLLTFKSLDSKGNRKDLRHGQKI